MSVTITLPASLADALMKALKNATPAKSAATVKVSAGAGAGAGTESFKITTLSKKIKDSATALLTENGFEFPEDDEKASKKIYDGFKAFVNENTFENIEEASAAFPKFWSEKMETTAKKVTSSPKKGSKKTAETVIVTKEDEIEVLSIEDLQAIEDLDETETPGVYRDYNSGRDKDPRNVTGPEADETEELKDMKFEGQIYSIAQTTYRVYQGASKNNFKGYAGVGKFKEMC